MDQFANVMIDGDDYRYIRDQDEIPDENDLFDAVLHLDLVDELE